LFDHFESFRAIAIAIPCYAITSTSLHCRVAPLNNPTNGLQDSRANNNYRGTGYIGSFTSLALLEAGYKVVIVDNLYNSSEEVINRIELISGKRPLFYKGDITDEAALDKIFQEHPDIDNVILFAALKVGHFPMTPSNFDCRC